MIHTLAWRPFLDPLDAHGVWYLFLIPLALGVSIAYKAVRVADLRGYWREVLTMTVQIIGAMIALALLTYVVIILILPLLPTDL